MSEVFSNFKVWPVKAQTGNFLANGKVVVAGTIQCNFKIMKGPKGIFAAFPSEKVQKEGSQEVSYFPHMNLLDDTTKELFQTEALAAYNTALENAGTSTPTGSPKKSTANIPF